MFGKACDFFWQMGNIVESEKLISLASQKLRFVVVSFQK